MGDPANGGLGLRSQDGASVRIVDDGTLITGALRGHEGWHAARSKSWLISVQPLQIKNKYNLRTPFVLGTSGIMQPPGDETTGVESGRQQNTECFNEIREMFKAFV